MVYPRQRNDLPLRFHAKARPILPISSIGFVPRAYGGMEVRTSTNKEMENLLQNTKLDSKIQFFSKTKIPL
jgi:hypothetical protein